MSRRRGLSARSRAVFYGRCKEVGRRLGILLALGLPAGCGFQPLYGERMQSEVGDKLAAIQVRPIPDRSGQILRNHLTESFRPHGSTGRTTHVLEVRLFEPQVETAVGRDDLPTRIVRPAYAFFQLRDVASNALVFQGTAAATTSYNIDSSEFATLSGGRTARDQSLRVIGDDIARQLALHFARRAGADR